MNKLGGNILVLTLNKDVCSYAKASEKLLEKNYTVLKASTIKTYESKIKNAELKIDCVLICSSLKDKLIEEVILKYVDVIPHILITDEANKHKAQSLINKGVKDYIISDRPSRLVPAVRREVTAFNEMKKHKLILEELRQSRERVVLHLNKSPLPIISWDLDFRATLWNKAATKVFGYTLEEAIGKSCLELTVPKGQEKKAKAIFKDLIQKKGTANNINETLTKSGKIIICHWYNTILEDNEGEVIGIISTIEDITERENERRNALKSQRLLENAQKLSEVYFIEINLNKNEVVLDNEFIKLSGLPKKESYKSSDFMDNLIYSGDKLRFLKAIKKTIKNNSKLAIDVRVVYKDGTLRWVNILADVLTDDLTKEKSLIGTFIDITERKEELFNLKKQKQKLDLAINVSNIGFLELDFSNNKVEVSDITKDLFELDKDVDIFDFKEILSRVHPDDLEKNEKDLETAISNKKPFQSNFRLALPSGLILWVNNVSEIIYNNAGKPLKMLSVFRDITHQVNRERRLLQHSLILNQISSLVLVLNNKGDFTFASPSVKELTGYSIADVLGQGWWNVSYTSTEEKVKSKQQFMRILRGEINNVSNLKYDRKVLCKDGQIKWFSWQFSRGTDKTIIGSAIDITKEKEKEFLVTKLFKALEASPTVVIITDIKGNIEYVNSKFEKVSGYTKEEVLGKNPRILKSGKTDKKVYTKLWKTILNGKTWYGEFENRKKDGTLFWEKSVITPVKNDEGVISNFIALKEDITEQKEQEKNFLYALFEAQENEKLKFGEDLHDSLSQILSAMSFYIDAVLNPKNKDLDAKAKYLEKVKELSTDALRESRHISHGLMSKQLLLGGLVAAVNEICENYNISRDVKFTFENKGYSEGILPAKSIQNIYRIIQEITTNIVRHAAASNASIRFTIENNEWFVLEIKDDGIGIDPKKSKQNSKGFGLKNIQQRVSLLNGKVKRYSKLNKGTKYNIRIPLLLQDNEQKQNLTSKTIET